MTSARTTQETMYPGIDSMGDLPAHWSVRRLKYLARERMRNGVGEAGAYDNPDWPRYVRITDIAGPRSLRDETFKSLPPELASTARFAAGDLLLAAAGSVGKSYLHTRDIGEVCFAGYLVRFSPGGDVDPEFVAYWTESAAFSALVQQRVVQATIQNFSAAKYQDLVMPLPPRDEQRTIVGFLNRKTARIDALIAKKGRLIELLQEKRLGLIAHAVTKGLDPNVPTRDSGIPWFREVPSHWRVRRLRFSTTSCQNGTWGSDPDGLNDVPCIRAADFDRVALRAGGEPPLRSVDERIVQSRGLRAGDLLLEISGGGENQPVGTVILYDQDAPAVCSNFVARVTVASGFDPGYLTYLHAALYAARINTRSIKQNTGLQNLDSESYLNEVVVFAPEDEQRAIAAFLERETATVDRLVDQVREAVDRLKELRAALISAAVTGKIDVRGEAIT